MHSRIKFKDRKSSSERGFVLVAAIMACLILLALAILVVHISTSDLRISAKTYGEKKALTAAETGLHQLMRTFDPANLSASAVSNVPVDPANVPGNLYSVGTPSLPTFGPVFLPMPGYSIGGGQSWGQRRYNVDIIGTNTTYATRVDLEVGVGYGPIEISTMSR